MPRDAYCAKSRTTCHCPQSSKGSQRRRFAQSRDQRSPAWHCCLAEPCPAARWAFPVATCPQGHPSAWHPPAPDSLASRAPWHRPTSPSGWRCQARLPMQRCFHASPASLLGRNLSPVRTSAISESRAASGRSIIAICRPPASSSTSTARTTSSCSASSGSPPTSSRTPSTPLLPTTWAPCSTRRSSISSKSPAPPEPCPTLVSRGPRRLSATCAAWSTPRSRRRPARA